MRINSVEATIKGGIFFRKVAFFLSLVAILHGFKCFGLTEDKLSSDWRTVYETWPKTHCSWSSFVSESGKKTGFVRCGQGTRPVVLLPGYSEPAVKYLETVFDLSQARPDLGPIYVMELPGQGTSDRLGDSPFQVHVDKDTRYTDDFQKFIDAEVVQTGAAKPIIISHSTGGMVALAAAARKTDQFDRIVALSPLIRPNLPLPVWAVRIISSLYVKFGFNETPVWGQASKPVEDQIFERNNSTSSKTRWTISHTLLVENPKIFTHGISWAWLKSVISEGDYVWDAREIIKIPILMIKPEKDFFVNGEQADYFCKSLATCEIKTIAGDKHETLQLADYPRDQTLAWISHFIPLPAAK